MIIEFANHAYMHLPQTLGIDRIRSAANYTPVRAPFSTVQTLSGDGRPKAEPFTISGTVYFADTASANECIMDIRNHIHDATALYIDGWLIDLHSADVVIVPHLLPRIVNIKMRVFPKHVEPLDWPSGLALEYRFDEGDGSTLIEHVSGQNGTITNPLWVSEGLSMSLGRYVTLPDSVNALYEATNWTQFATIIAQSGSESNAGIVGKIGTNNLSGEMRRTLTSGQTTLVTSTNSNTYLGGEFWNGTPRIVHSYRNGGTRGLDIKPVVDPAYVLIGGSTSAGNTGTRTFGRNRFDDMVGTFLYYVLFNRTLTDEEKLLVYRILRYRMLERGVDVQW